MCEVCGRTGAPEVPRALGAPQEGRGGEGRREGPPVIPSHMGPTLP